MKPNCFWKLTSDWMKSPHTDQSKFAQGSSDAISYDVCSDVYEEGYCIGVKDLNFTRLVKM